MNSLVDHEKRRQFDRELVALRINGSVSLSFLLLVCRRSVTQNETNIRSEIQVSQLLNQYADHYCKRDNIVSIGPIILVIPIIVLVLPPLILSVAVVFW